MSNAFKSELISALGDKPHAEILEAMGYRNPGAENLERLKNVLGSEYLGLDGGSFDLKYSSAEFLQILSNVAGLDKENARQRIGDIKQHLSDEWQAFKPYIWVDTHFKRTTQSFFALAACESFRYLKFPSGFWRLTSEEQLRKAQALACQHTKETGGKLKMWGQIQQYWFFYAPRKAYILSPEGKVISEHQG